MASQASGRKRRRPLEGLEILIGCAGALGILAGFLPSLVSGPLGLVFLGGTGLGALLHIIATVRFGGSLGQALLEIVLYAGLTFGLVYGVFWYFTVYLAAQPDIMNFGGASKP